MTIIITLWISVACALNLGFTSFTTTLAVANTRQTISATLINSSDFIIQNPSTNIVSIFLGGSDVTTSGATQGIEMVPGATIALSHPTDNLASSKIFIVSTGTSIPVIVGSIIK